MFKKISSIGLALFAITTLFSAQLAPTAFAADPFTFTFTPQLTAPVIIGPSNAPIIRNSFVQTTLTWSPVAGATFYQIQMSYAPLGSSYWTDYPLYTSTTTSYTTASVLPDDNSIRFIVRAVDSYGNAGPWSEYRTFSFHTTVQNSNTLATPYVITPYENSVLTNFPRTATVTWTSVPTAAFYRVEVACDICTSTTTKWLNPDMYAIYATSYTTEKLAGDNQFRIRVLAQDAYGNQSQWSDYRYFSYNTSGATSYYTAPSENIFLEYRYFRNGNYQSPEYGQLMLKTESAQSGYNFNGYSYENVTNGAFYAHRENGKLQFWGNNLGQGGTVDFGSISTFSSSIPPTSGYNRQGVEVINGHTYAVYDQTHNTYALMRVTNGGAQETYNSNTAASCANLSGGAGSYSLCNTWSFTHTPTGLTFTLIMANSKQTRLRVEGAGMRKTIVYLKKGAFKIFATKSGFPVKIIYNGVSSQRANFVIE